MSKSQYNTDQVTWVKDVAEDATVDIDLAGNPWVIMRGKNASAAGVDLILNADPNDDDGRSPWFWLRLPNDDLVLACFPQGDTYEAISQSEGI